MRRTIGRAIWGAMSVTGFLLAAAGLSGCGSESVMLEAKSADAVTQETSLVVFVRPGKAFAVEMTRLWDGDQFIGELKGNQKLEYSTTPGKHLFVATNNTGGSAFLDAEVGAGKKYVVRGHVFPAGFGKAGVVLVPLIPGEKADVGPNEVNAMLAECTPQMKDPAKADAYAAKLRPDLDAAMAASQAGTAKTLTLAEKDSW